MSSKIKINEWGLLENAKKNDGQYKDLVDRPMNPNRLFTQEKTQRFPFLNPFENDQEKNQEKWNENFQQFSLYLHPEQHEYVLDRLQLENPVEPAEQVADDIARVAERLRPEEYPGQAHQAKSEENADQAMHIRQAAQVQGPVHLFSGLPGPRAEDQVNAEEHPPDHEIPAHAMPDAADEKC